MGGQAVSVPLGVPPGGGRAATEHQSDQHEVQARGGLVATAAPFSGKHAWTAHRAVDSMRTYGHARAIRGPVVEGRQSSGFESIDGQGSLPLASRIIQSI